MTRREPKPKGRPPILKLCGSVFHEGDRELPTSSFPTQATAAFKDCCKVCCKLERKAYRADTPLREKEEREAARIARLRDSPQLIEFARDLDARVANRKAMQGIAEFFNRICRVRCECCYTEPATGQDTIGLRSWCTLCGWGIQRTGRCLAHPGGEVFYPGLPGADQPLTLPAELLATMKGPAPAPQEAPPRDPSEEDHT